MSDYVQYGCGLSAPEGWLNFDASPTLRIQKIPFIGKALVKNRVVFPASVQYGDILKGLPGIGEQGCKGIYCSHVLEHLSLEDFRLALRNTYRYLKPGGIFRCVVPDLEYAIHLYTATLKEQKEAAAFQFMNNTLLGLEKRPRGFNGLLTGFLGNAHHLWMWDQYSLAAELKAAGFASVRNCRFNDSADKHFELVEDEGRFLQAVAIEAIK
jgi:predicted SAM-dependent methyltransferase